MMGGHVDGMGWWLLLLAAVGTVAFWVAVALVIRVLLPAREREDSSPDRHDLMPVPTASLVRRGECRGQLGPMLPGHRQPLDRP